MRQRLLHSSDQRGFSLPELLIALLITLVVMGGTMMAFKDAVGLSRASQQRIDLDDNMRVALDLLVRDFISIGDGLPNGKILPVPNGAGAKLINRPGPSLGTFPAGTSDFSAVMPGYQLAPAINGAKTNDVITILSADSTFEDQVADMKSDGTLATFANAVTGIPDPLRDGDLLMLTVNGEGTALQMVTGFDSATVVRFEDGDPMQINQPDAPNGSITLLDPDATLPTFVVHASRVRMISFWVEQDVATGRLQLMRQINMRTPQRVASWIENLQFTYDLVDGITNPVDQNNPGNPTQIRKINIFLAARSDKKLSNTGDFLRTTMTTQVSLRSLALVDRYL